MDNKEISKRIALWQQDSSVHKLTCGNDSGHLPLLGKEIDGKVVLYCVECDYIQENIPSVIFNLNKKTFNSEAANNAQIEFCDKEGFPHFAPRFDCYNCGVPIYSIISVEEASRSHIMSCPKCSWSYCD